MVKLHYFNSLVTSAVKDLIIHVILGFKTNNCFGRRGGGT